MRYFSNPVVLLRGPKQRPIADIVATDERICNAVADAQEMPVGPKDTYSWIEHGAEMWVIYPSLMIVVDTQPKLWRGSNEADCRDIMFEQCSVLLVRTGHEEHLSAPIDVSELDPALVLTSRPRWVVAE